MATFEKRPGGWRVRIRKAGMQPLSASFRTKAEAQHWAATTEAELASLKRGGLPDRPFADLIDRYIKEISPAKRGEREEVFRLRRTIGLGEDVDGKPRKRSPLADILLADLDARHFAEWRDQRLKEVSPTSVLREWSTLSHACTVAVKEWGWLRQNPMSAVSKPKAAKARGRRFTDDEIDRLLLATGYEADQTPVTKMARVGAVMLFAIETAMRAGEIVGLTWNNVDLDRRLAHLPMTKNGHARDVPLSRAAMRLIEQVRPLRDDSGSVFQICSDTLDALFRKAKARALIEDLHFHDTRREALTRLADKVDVMTLAKISGHRDLRILQNTYYAPDMANVAPLLD